MQLCVINSPRKSVCFATPDESCATAWSRLRAMHAPLLLVTTPGGQAIGALSTGALRPLMDGRVTISQLPLRSVSVLSPLACITDVLRELGDASVEAVVLGDGARVVSVIVRAAA